MMEIGVIGAGNVGGTLGRRWAQAGHAVVFGVRDPNDAKVRTLLASAGANARAGRVEEATAASAVVVLTVPWEAAHDAVRSAGDLTGKVLVDATNPVAMSPAGLQQGLLVGHTTSAAEQVAAWAQGARVVKAFNTTGFGNMHDPRYGSHAATMFLCGDDGEAKAMVTQLGEDLGFEMLDAGPLTIARLLEPLAMLWIHLAVFQGLGPDIAFTLQRR
jgi:8-hydroxy-5-deazaflavin:NADPH oxidoreductase